MSDGEGYHQKERMKGRKKAEKKLVQSGIGGKQISTALLKHWKVTTVSFTVSLLTLMQIILIAFSAANNTKKCF